MLENIRNFGLGFFDDLNDLIPARSEFFEAQDDASEDSGFWPDLTEEGKKRRDLVISALSDASKDLTPDFSDNLQVATRVTPFNRQQYEDMLAQMVEKPKRPPGILERFRAGLA